MECKPLHFLFLDCSRSCMSELAMLLVQMAESVRISRAKTMEDAIHFVARESCDAVFLGLARPESKEHLRLLKRCAPHLPIFAWEQPEPAVSRAAAVHWLPPKLTAKELKQQLGEAKVMLGEGSATASPKRRANCGGVVSEASELSWSLIHELTQPLTAMSNFASAGLIAADTGLENPRSPKETFATFGQLAQQAIRVLMCLRKLSLGDPVDREQVQVNEAVEAVYEQLTNDLQNAQAHVQLVLEPDLPPAWGNGVQVCQILLNLCKNALEAVVEMEPVRRVIQIETSHNDGLVCVTVADRGPGMNRHTLGHIFEPRFTTKPSGMGVGLPISRAMLSSMGGSLECTSQENVGTTFRCLLPIAESR